MDDRSAAPAIAPPLATATTVIQRKCACGGGGAVGALTGECEECQGKRLQRRASGGAVPAEVPAIVDEVIGGPGEPLDAATRRSMESRFGHDFSAVRIHTDTRAAASARAVGALAYTVGKDIVFGMGQYAPRSTAGRHLLAHELTHTIQQSGVTALQRQAETSAAPEPAGAEAEADRAAGQATSGLIVEDDGQPGAGQMRKSEFLDELQQASCAAADAELQRAGRSTEGCPYIERAFGRYRTMTATQVETGVRRYVDPAGVSTARDYIPRVSRRVGEGVARWVTTGDMSAVPPELAADFGGAGGGGLSGMLGGGLAGVVGGFGRLLFKRAAEGSATAQETSLAAAHLGEGAPMETATRGRMERAFGYDFSAVRIHRDGRAAAASSTLGARAFTIGRDIGFGESEYRPGTLVGDALLAHELAHVVQQSGSVEQKGTAAGALDEEADRSAVGAVTRIWTGAKNIAASALPRLRSGLRLQRCSTTLHSGRVTGGGQVEAVRGPLAVAGEDWMTLQYSGAAARRRRWMQFFWAEIIVDTAQGPQRASGVLPSTATWSRVQLTTDPSNPFWQLDGAAASEPFYDIGSESTDVTSIMRDKPSGHPNHGAAAMGQFPGATSARMLQHFDTYLMDNASVTLGPQGQRDGHGNAIYHVTWLATTNYQPVSGGARVSGVQYGATGGGNVSGLPARLIQLLDSMYGQGEHHLT